MDAPERRDIAGRDGRPEFVVAFPLPGEDPETVLVEAGLRFASGLSIGPDGIRWFGGEGSAARPTTAAALAEVLGMNRKTVTASFWKLEQKQHARRSNKGWLIDAEAAAARAKASHRCAKVPGPVLSLRHLPAGCKLLLGRLISTAGVRRGRRPGSVFVLGLRHLAQDIGASARQARRYVAILKALGWAITERHHRGRGAGGHPLVLTRARAASGEPWMSADGRTAARDLLEGAMSVDGRSAGAGSILSTGDSEPAISADVRPDVRGCHAGCPPMAAPHLEVLEKCSQSGPGVLAERDAQTGPGPEPVSEPGKDTAEQDNPDRPAGWRDRKLDPNLDPSVVELIGEVVRKDISILERHELLQRLEDTEFVAQEILRHPQRYTQLMAIQELCGVHRGYGKRRANLAGVLNKAGVDPRDVLAVLRHLVRDPAIDKPAAYFMTVVKTLVKPGYRDVLGARFGLDGLATNHASNGARTVKVVEVEPVDIQLALKVDRAYRDGVSLVDIATSLGTTKDQALAIAEQGHRARKASAR